VFLRNLSGVNRGCRGEKEVDPRGEETSHKSRRKYGAQISDQKGTSPIMKRKLLKNVRGPGKVIGGNKKMEREAV